MYVMKTNCPSRLYFDTTIITSPTTPIFPLCDRDEMYTMLIFFYGRRITDSIRTVRMNVCASLYIVDSFVTTHAHRERVRMMKKNAGTALRRDNYFVCVAGGGGRARVHVSINTLEH